MCSGDKKCPKKMSIICSFFLAVLLSFFCALQPLSANALAPDVYQVYYNIYGLNNDAYSWTSELSNNDYFYLNNGKRYQWKINSLAYNGNYLAIHFETNIVYPDVGHQTGGFRNLDNLFVSFCGSGGLNGTIRSSAIRTAKTVWYSDNNTTENLTLTIYGDAVVSGLQYTSGNHDLYCGIATSDGNPFIYSVNNGIPSQFYFEQSPTTVQFTNDISDALDSSRNNILNNIDNSINNISNQYNQEKEDLVNKESELNSQSEDLSLSADAPNSSLLYRWFYNWVSQPCFTTRTIHTWFNTGAFTFCSPYPSAVRTGVTFASNFLVAAFLIRIYAKHMKGGYNG